MRIGRTGFNLEALKGKTETQIRKELSGFSEEVLDELVKGMKKEGLLKTKKKKDVEEGGE